MSDIGENLHSQVNHKLAETVAGLKELILPQVMELEQQGHLPFITIGTRTDNSYNDYSTIIETTRIPALFVNYASISDRAIVLTSENLFSMPRVIVSRHVSSQTDTSQVLPSWRFRHSSNNVWLNWASRAADQLSDLQEKSSIKQPTI